MSTTTLLLVLDLVGIAVFAFSGGLVGVEKNLDIFGVLALAATSALGGGIIRDLLLGIAPPATFTDARYLVVPVVCGVFVFYVHPTITLLQKPVLPLPKRLRPRLWLPFQVRAIRRFGLRVNGPEFRFW